MLYVLAYGTRKRGKGERPVLKYQPNTFGYSSCCRKQIIKCGHGNHTGTYLVAAHNYTYTKKPFLLHYGMSKDKESQKADPFLQRGFVGIKKEQQIYGIINNHCSHVTFAWHGSLILCGAQKEHLSGRMSECSWGHTLPTPPQTTTCNMNRINSFQKGL